MKAVMVGFTPDAACMVVGTPMDKHSVPQSPLTAKQADVTYTYIAPGVCSTSLGMIPLNQRSPLTAAGSKRARDPDTEGEMGLRLTDVDQC